MSGEVIYELFNETPRWSRALSASCAVVVALLALWIFIPIAFGNHFSAPHHHAKNPQTLTQNSKAAAATSNIRVIGIYSARPMAELAPAEARQTEIMEQSASTAGLFEPVASVVMQSTHDTGRGAVSWRAMQPS
jgi:hypothetical protein